MLDPCGVVRRCGQGDDGEEEWAQLIGSMSLSHGSEITGHGAKPQGEERLKKHVGARSKVAVLRCAARLAYTFRALTANGFWANLHQVLASYMSWLMREEWLSAMYEQRWRGLVSVPELP